MNYDIISQRPEKFEALRHQDQKGNEYWLARQLAQLLEYSEYSSFENIIERAKEACRNSGHLVKNHFENINLVNHNPVETNNSNDDMRLSRYACYLILQNGDPGKPMMAQEQTYFAVQTRKQELATKRNRAQVSEDRRRLMLRDELTYHNKELVAAAQGAGISTGREYAAFQDHGYKGLYGGLSAKEIHNRKKLKKNQKILDHMGSTELAANLFRATQTEEKLRRDRVKSKSKANWVHERVGNKIRSTIAELGGTMPEDLDTPEKSIQRLTREKKSSVLVSHKNSRNL